MIKFDYLNTYWYNATYWQVLCSRPTCLLSLHQLPAKAQEGQNSSNVELQQKEGMLMTLCLTQNRVQIAQLQRMQVAHPSILLTSFLIIVSFL